MNQDDDIRRGHAMVDEADLLDLFAKRRPDPAAFARGVQQRLLDRSDHDGGAAPLARAAGRVPVDLAALTAAKWSAMAPPALLLAAIAGVFFASIRWLRSTIARAPVRTARVPLGFGSAAEQVATLALSGVLLAGIALFPSTAWITDGLLLLLLATMVTLVIAVRRTAATHGLDAAMIATLGIGCLQSLAVLGLFWMMLDGPFAGAAQWQSATAITLAGGMLALLPAAPRSWWGVGLTVGMLAWLGLRDSGTREPDLDSLATFVAEAKAPTEPFLGCDDLAKIVRELRASGRPVALPPAVDAALVAARDAANVAFFALSAEAQLGRIDTAEWRRLGERRDHAATLDRLLRGTHPLRPTRGDDYQIAMLVATRDLDDATRDRLARRVMAGLADPTFPLQDTAAAARWLDTIGRGALLDERRAAIHDLLVRHQFLGSLDPGGFAPRLDIAHSNHEANEDALDLMERFGVPAELDLPTLHRHLRRQGRLFTAVPLAESGYQLVAYVDRLRLERLLGGPPHRSLLRTLHEERAFVAMLLLVLLCVHATWAAPRREQLPAAGAMP